MGNYSLGEGVVVSIFSIIIVFLILILLSVIIMLLKYIPFKNGEERGRKSVPASAVSAVTPGISAAQSIDDEEERMVAMLVASCMAKENIKGDVRVTSVERIK